MFQGCTRDGRGVASPVMRLLVLSLVVLALTACGRDDGRRGAEVSHRDASKILESTPWLDRAPEHESDIVHAWIFPRGEGLYFVGNAYKGAYETFRYFVEEDQIKVRFNHDGKSHTMRFTIERVDDRVFDYRLTFDQSPRGPKVYYGFEQHRDLQRDLPAPTRSLLESLPR